MAKRHASSNFNRIVFTIFGVAFLLIAVAVGYKVMSATSLEVACTQEAKACPDGSYVGRTGPSCEFAPCPEL